MRVSSALAGFVAAGAGLATGVVGYQNSAAIPDVPELQSSPVVAAGKPLPDAPPRIRTELADCVAPAELEDGVCVTRVVKQVPAPAPEAEAVEQPVTAAPAPAAPPVAAAAPPAPALPAQEHCDDSGSDPEDAEEAAEEREEAEEEAAEDAEEAAEEREEAEEEAAEDTAEEAEEREDAAEDAGDEGDSGSEADC